MNFCVMSLGQEEKSFMITEQQLEDAAIGWFGELGWQYVNGPAIAPDSDSPARTDYRQVVLRGHLTNAVGFREGDLKHG